MLRKAVNLVGLRGDHIMGHSFRIGAASSALHVGVAKADIQAMGRWRSNAFWSYIRPLPVCNIWETQEASHKEGTASDPVP